MVQGARNKGVKGPDILLWKKIHFLGVQMKIEDLSKELDESAFSLYLHLPKLYKKGDLKSIGKNSI